MDDKFKNHLVQEWKFISEAKPGYKPCFKDKKYINVNEWFVTFKRRYIMGETGENGIKYVHKLIDLSIDYIKNTDYTNFQDLRNILFEADVGLQNIMNTYQNCGQYNISESYKNCMEKIETMVAEIDSFLKNVKN